MFSPLTAAPAQGQGQGHVESETQPEEGKSHGGLWTFVVVILKSGGTAPVACPHPGVIMDIAGTRGCTR